MIIQLSIIKFVQPSWKQKCSEGPGGFSDLSRSAELKDQEYMHSYSSIFVGASAQIYLAG
jgi:hypothetical protein